LIPFIALKSLNCLPGNLRNSPGSLKADGTTCPVLGPASEKQPTGSVIAKLWNFKVED
jgi:hypothetical protein